MKSISVVDVLQAPFWFRCNGGSGVLKGAAMRTVPSPRASQVAPVHKSWPSNLGPAGCCRSHSVAWYRSVFGTPRHECVPATRD
jgi:hypothetical protein